MAGIRRSLCTAAARRGHVGSRVKVLGIEFVPGVRHLGIGVILSVVDIHLFGFTVPYPTGNHDKTGTREFIGAGRKGQKLIAGVDINSCID